MVEITRSGQSNLGSLNGKLVFEQDNNRIIGRDANNVIRMSIDAANDFAVDFYDENGLLVSRYDGDGQKYFDSSGAVRALFDVNGIKVSQAGFDATTAAAGDLVFSSAFNLFKIVQTGTASINSIQTGGASMITTITHNLGYTPAHLVFAEFPPSMNGLYGLTGITLCPASFSFLGASQYEVKTKIVTSANSTTLKISVGDYLSTGVWNFRYYLMQETAN